MSKNQKKNQLQDCHDEIRQLNEKLNLVENADPQMKTSNFNPNNLNFSKIVKKHIENDVDMSLSGSVEYSCSGEEETESVYERRSKNV